MWLYISGINAVTILLAQAEALPGWVTPAAIGAQTVLLVPVLYWIGWKQLPEESKQRTSLLKMAEAEREKDRASRHGIAEKFQDVIADMYEKNNEQRAADRREYRESLSEILNHGKDENNRVIDALKSELSALRAEFQTLRAELLTLRNEFGKGVSSGGSSKQSGS